MKATLTITTMVLTLLAMSTAQAFNINSHNTDNSVRNTAKAKASAKASNRTNVRVGVRNNNYAGGGSARAYGGKSNAYGYTGGNKLTVEGDSIIYERGHRNRVGATAPDLTAGDCIGSSSVGLPGLSVGGTREPDGCAAWRDAFYAKKVGMSDRVAYGLLCQYKNFRRVAHLDGIDCKALLKRPMAETPVTDSSSYRK